MAMDHKQKVPKQTRYSDCSSSDREVRERLRETPLSQQPQQPQRDRQRDADSLSHTTPEREFSLSSGESGSRPKTQSPATRASKTQSPAKRSNREDAENAVPRSPLYAFSQRETESEFSRAQRMHKQRERMKQYFPSSGSSSVQCTVSAKDAFSEGIAALRSESAAPQRRDRANSLKESPSHYHTQTRRSAPHNLLTQPTSRVGPPHNMVTQPEPREEELCGRESERDEDSHFGDNDDDSRASERQALSLQDLSQEETQLLICDYFGGAAVPVSDGATASSQIRVTGQDLLFLEEVQDLRDLGFKALPNVKLRRALQEIHIWRAHNGGCLPATVTQFLRDKMRERDRERERESERESGSIGGERDPLPVPNGSPVLSEGAFRNGSIVPAKLACSMSTTTSAVAAGTPAGVLNMISSTERERRRRRVRTPRHPLGCGGAAAPQGERERDSSQPALTTHSTASTVSVSERESERETETEKATERKREREAAELLTFSRPASLSLSPSPSPSLSLSQSLPAPRALDAAELAREDLLVSLILRKFAAHGLDVSLPPSLSPSPSPSVTGSVAAHTHHSALSLPSHPSQLSHPTHTHHTTHTTHPSHPTQQGGVSEVAQRAADAQYAHLAPWQTLSLALSTHTHFPRLALLFCAAFSAVTQSRAPHNAPIQPTELASLCRLGFDALAAHATQPSLCLSLLQRLSLLCFALRDQLPHSLVDNDIHLLLLILRNARQAPPALVREAVAVLDTMPRFPELAQYLVNSTDAVTLVVELLNFHVKSAAVVVEITNFVTKLVANCETAQIQCARACAGQRLSLLAAFAAHRANTAVVRGVCACLAGVALCGEGARRVCEDRGVETLCETLSLFLGRTASPSAVRKESGRDSERDRETERERSPLYRALHAALALLWTLSLHRESARRVGERGGCVVLVRLLERERDSERCVDQLCGALANLADCDENHAKFLDISMSWQSCVIHNSSEESVNTGDFSPSVCELLLSVLSQHSASHAVCETLCGALAALAEHDTHGRTALRRTAEGVPLLLSVLRTHAEHPDAVRHACTVLRAKLSLSFSVTERDREREGGAEDAALRAHTTRAYIAINDRAMRERGAPHLLVSLLRSYGAHGGAAQSGQAVLQALLGCLRGLCEASRESATCCALSGAWDEVALCAHREGERDALAALECVRVLSALCDASLSPSLSHTHSETERERERERASALVLTLLSAASVHRHTAEVVRAALSLSLRLTEGEGEGEGETSLSGLTQRAPRSPSAAPHNALSQRALTLHYITTSSASATSSTSSAVLGLLYELLSLHARTPDMVLLLARLALSLSVEPLRAAPDLQIPNHSMLQISSSSDPNTTEAVEGVHEEMFLRGQISRFPIPQTLSVPQIWVALLSEHRGTAEVVALAACVCACVCAAIPECARVCVQTRVPTNEQWLCERVVSERGTKRKARERERERDDSMSLLALLSLLSHSHIRTAEVVQGVAHLLDSLSHLLCTQTEREKECVYAHALHALAAHSTSASVVDALTHTLSTLLREDLTCVLRIDTLAHTLTPLLHNVRVHFAASDVALCERVSALQKEMLAVQRAAQC